MTTTSDDRHHPGRPGPNLILAGPPGAGKGSVAAGLQALKLEHVSSGELFREEVASGSSLGVALARVLKEGRFVSDEETLSLMRKWYFGRGRGRGFLLDGFPRNLLQGEVFAEWLEQRREVLDAVIYLKLTEELSVRRISERRVCPVDGTVYHLTYNPPKREGVCDVCGNALVQREDDREETVRRRWRVFEENTLPLISYYRDQGVLIEADASAPLASVQAEVLEKLKERNLA